MITWELIKALQEGKTLYKFHHEDPDCKETLTWKVHICKDDNCEVGIHQILNYFGWGSANGNLNDRIMDLINYPEKWRVE